MAQKNFIIFIILLSILFPYNISNLISDYEFTNLNYTLKQTKEFCKSFSNNRLTDYQITYIYYYSMYNELNILVSLSVLEKESCLVVNNTDTDYYWRESRCMGAALFKHKWVKGLKFYTYGFFEIQVHRGLEVLRERFNKFEKGKVILLQWEDNQKVLPVNAASYSLYCYTPFYDRHNAYNRPAIGNKSFCIIYNKFKTKWYSMFK